MEDTCHQPCAIFFVVDNRDFNEDKPGRKHTLHATATALYQLQESFTDLDRQNTRKLGLHGLKPRDRSLTSLTAPEFVPNKQGFNGVASFASFKSKNVKQPYSAQDTSWLLSHMLMSNTETKDATR